MRETIDWTEVAASGNDERPPRRGGGRRLGRLSTKAMLGGSILVLTLSAAGVVGAKTGETLKEGVRNGTATKETRVISKVTGEQYGTRQSNVSEGATSGGSAIYGCRRPTKECTRHVNLSNGPAAAFATKGLVPFTLSSNAIGKVVGLNADRLDNLDVTEVVAAARAGKAASAGNADTATKATTADTATTAGTAGTAAAVSGRTPLGKMTFVSSSASSAVAATARAAANEVSLLKFGPFEIYGKCFVDSTVPELRAEVFVRTTQNGALLDGGGSGLLNGDPAYLNTGTAEIDRQLDDATAGPNAAAVDMDEEPGGLVTGDGTIYEFRHVQVVKNGTIGGGDGPYGAGQRCGFAASENS